MWRVTSAVSFDSVCFSLFLAFALIRDVLLSGEHLSLRDCYFCLHSKRRDGVLQSESNQRESSLRVSVSCARLLNRDKV